MYIQFYNYSLNQIFTIMQCTSHPISDLSRFEAMFLAEVKCLYFASNSYLHWHDEFRCEEDYSCIKKMNNALMQMRCALDKLEKYLD